MSNPHGDGSYRININNGLLLYCHQFSFYSQKVMMALHEKNLPFEVHIVDLIKGAQYEPWFLQLNPRGEVPVLQDTGKIIPDSGRIIDYLEDNFSNGDTPRLIPLDKGSDVKQKIQQFRQMIDQLPVGIVTMGSFIHTEFVKNPKTPFFAPVRKEFLKHQTTKSVLLRKHADLNESCREILLQKAEVHESKQHILLNKAEYIKVLDQVDEVLSTIELELSQITEDKQDWWLCTDRFSVADIAFTVLLERLNQLGLEHRFWSNGLRPNIEKYFARVKQRHSYRKIVPTTWTTIKIMLSAQNPIFLSVSAISAISLFIGGVFILRKYLKI